MTSKGVSRRAFAELDGCSETLVRRGLKQRKLVAFKDGTIDPSLAGTPWRVRNHDVRTPGANSSHADASLLSFADAQTKKENYLAKLRELEFEVKSGALVDRAAAAQTFFECSRESRDAWIAWPARIAVTVAAELGVDARLFTTVIGREVSRHLSEQGEPHAEGLAE